MEGIAASDGSFPLEFNAIALAMKQWAVEYRMIA